MVTAKTVVTRARVEGLAIVLLALGYLWETRAIPSLYQMPGVPGPAAFPTMLGIALGLAGLWRLVVGAAAIDDREPSAGAEGDRRQAAVGARVRGWLAAHGRFCGLWAVILGFLALMPHVGFPVAAAIALTLMFRLLGERRWPMCGALGLGAAAVMHLAFAVGLGVRLPLGILSLLGK